jgi:hypothetical protein
MEERGRKGHPPLARHANLGGSQVCVGKTAQQNWTGEKKREEMVRVANGVARGIRP